MFLNWDPGLVIRLIGFRRPSGLREKSFALKTPQGVENVPMLNALNEIMRESYLKDCDIGLRRWNRAIERAGFPALALKLPSSRFRRSIGAWVGQPVTPEGAVIDKNVFESQLGDWIPTAEDKAFVH